MRDNIGCVKWEAGMLKTASVIDSKVETGDLKTETFGSARLELILHKRHY